MGWHNRILPKGHICNPPLGEKDDQRWRCWGCSKWFWYNKADRRWELIFDANTAHLPKTT